MVKHLGTRQHTFCGAAANAAPADAPVCKRCAKSVAAARRVQSAAVAGSARLTILARTV